MQTQMNVPVLPESYATLNDEEILDLDTIQIIDIEVHQDLMLTIHRS